MIDPAAGPCRGTVMSMRKGMVIPLLLVVGLGTSAPAHAKAPPKGLYECTIGGTLFGDVTITGATTYKRFGKTGTFSAKGTRVREGGVRAYKISFTKGPFKGFRGDWRKTTDGKYEIALRNPRDDFESIYCDK